MGRRSRWTESCFGTPSLTSSRSSTSISRACIESRDGSEVDYYIHQKHLSSKACYWPPYCLRHSLPLTHTTVVYFSFFCVCVVYTSLSLQCTFFFTSWPWQPSNPPPHTNFFFAVSEKRVYLYESPFIQTVVPSFLYATSPIEEYSPHSIYLPSRPYP